MKVFLKNSALLFLLFLCGKATSQEINIGLSIGDSLPNFAIPKLLGSNKKAHTSDYKNKLLIIDFWSTGCGTCIESLPKMNNLQRKFNGAVKILPVTYESGDVIRKFWKRNKYTRDIEMLSVVEDKIFHKYFKHRFIPHEVWVYKGIIIGITSLEYVDAYNIRKVFDGETINWHLKNDFYTFDDHIPLFTPNEDRVSAKTSIINYAAVSDFRPKVNPPIWLTGGSGIIRDTVNRTIRTFFLNQPILNSYLSCFLKVGTYRNLVRPPYNGVQPNQIIWEVTDKSKYTYVKKLGVYQQNWLVKNGICFESQYVDKGQTVKEINETILEDLNRLLGLHVRWEKRREKVFVMKRNEAFNTVVDKKGFHHDSYNLNSICYNLNNEGDNPYVFLDGIEDTTKIFLNVKSWKDILAVKKELRRYGFDLKPEIREVDKLIFSEINGGTVVSTDMQNEAKIRKRISDNFEKIQGQNRISFLEQNGKKHGVRTLASGLQYLIIKEGNGKRPSPASEVLVNYEGKLVNGHIFASSFALGLPAIMQSEKVVNGLKEALTLMREGSEWEIYIPANLGYGSHTGHGTVPPNSILIFRVELLKVLL